MYYIYYIIILLLYVLCIIISILVGALSGSSYRSSYSWWFLWRCILVGVGVAGLRRSDPHSSARCCRPRPCYRNRFPSPVTTPINGHADFDWNGRFFNRKQASKTGHFNRNSQYCRLYIYNTYIYISIIYIFTGAGTIPRRLDLHYRLYTQNIMIVYTK